MPLCAGEVARCQEFKTSRQGLISVAGRPGWTSPSSAGSRRDPEGSRPSTAPWNGAVLYRALQTPRLGGSSCCSWVVNQRSSISILQMKELELGHLPKVTQEHSRFPALRSGLLRAIFACCSKCPCSTCSAVWLASLEAPLCTETVVSFFSGRCWRC